MRNANEYTLKLRKKAPEWMQPTEREKEKKETQNMKNFTENIE